jgi:hypothetical protein
MNDLSGLKKGIPVAVLLTALCGCGGGGGGDSPPPSQPAPPPTVPPPPPPPPATTTPPLSSTVIDLSGNQRIGIDHWSDGNSPTGGQGQTVAGLECLPTMPEDYHVHSHITIFLNGEKLAVSRNAGIANAPQGRCFYGIHTHDYSGKIHVESEAPGMFTLGQFFQIWGRSLTNTDLAGITGLPIVIYTTDDGTVTEVKDNWADIELKSHREITIVVGTPITEIPNYTWNGD